MRLFVRVEGNVCGEGQVAVIHASHPSSPVHLELDPSPPDDGPGAQSDRFITHVPGTISHTHK